jgi:hypothetical protein
MSTSFGALRAMRVHMMAGRGTRCGTIGRGNVQWNDDFGVRLWSGRISSIGYEPTEETESDRGQRFGVQLKVSSAKRKLNNVALILIIS